MHWQDYARHLVNSYIVGPLKSSEALASGMLEVASNDIVTLRHQLSQNARMMVCKYYNPHRVELHAAMMLRYASDLVLLFQSSSAVHSLLIFVSVILLKLFS